MSNRGRQNVASFLMHDLKLPWTWGARYFEEKLIDYDPDLNWGNWLYFSGYGSDPRSRKFNIKSQAETYDPAGEYRRKWLDQV
jgi:deoxyribodipyrimidine photo-lyase